VFEGRGEPGTPSAAVKRVQELMPAMFDDMIKGMPAEQRPKLENMLGIWEKGSTFPVKILADLRGKLSVTAATAPVPATNGSAAVQPAQRTAGEKFMAPIPSRPLHTPVGYPPQYLYEQGFIVKPGAGQPANGTAAAHSRPPPPQQAPAQTQPTPAAPPPPTQDVNSILAMLANAVPKPVAPAPAPPAMQQQQPPPSQVALPQQLPPNLAALFQQQTLNGAPPGFPPPQPPPFSAPPPMATPMQMPPFQPPQGFPGFPGFPQFPPQQPPSIAQQYAVAPPPPQPAAQMIDALGPLRGILPPNIINDQGKLVAALNLLQDLQKQGLPMDQWGPILKAFDDAQGPSQPPANGHDTYDRRRSRSPERGGGGRGGRGSPVYGSYDDLAGRSKPQDDPRNRGNNNAGNGGARNRFRQRSPIHSMRDLPMRNSPAPAHNGAYGSMQPKYIAIDSSLPHDNIKVLSRTLFVGGANGTQPEIQGVFERFGKVQTCIANRDKRHAFVKMTTRNYALAAKAGMEELQNRNDREVMSVARQTKWGVGFGPRECCNYTTGESVIPLGKLTEADIKWLMTAEYGGTGGKTLEGGMVLEEPDIEIGAGVSSKAMSKRVLPADGGAAERGGAQQQGGHAQGQQGGGGERKKAKHHHKRQQHDYGMSMAGTG